MTLPLCCSGFRILSPARIHSDIFLWAGDERGDERGEGDETIRCTDTVTQTYTRTSHTMRQKGFIQSLREDSNERANAPGREGV